MARMHSRRKGKAGSTKPIKKTKKSWVRYKPKEVEQLVIKLAKSGRTPSQVGLILRDTYGVPDVRTTTNKKMMKILEENKLVTPLPEDMTALIRKELALVKHLETNKKDMISRRGLLLINSKIRRLVKYYKSIGKLPADWAYDREKAKLLVQ